MVKIEFLVDTECDLQSKPTASSASFPESCVDRLNHPWPLLPGEETALNVLAQNCAATVIQSFLRGTYQRKIYHDKAYRVHLNRHDEGAPVFCPISTEDLLQRLKRLDASSAIIQRAWRRNNVTRNKYQNLDDGDIEREATEDDHVAVIEYMDRASQTIDEHENRRAVAIDDELNYHCTREEAVLNAHRLCKSKRSGVYFNGYEVVNMLKAMNVIGPREHEIMTGALSETNRRGLGTSGSHVLYGTDTRFSLRISGSLEEFEQDLVGAWRKIGEISDYGRRSTIPKKRTRFRLNSHVKRAKENIQELVDIPADSILLLTQNPGVMSYSNEVASAFLATLGVELQEHSGSSTTTFIEQIRQHARKTESALYRARFDMAYQMILCISQWEVDNPPDISSNSDLGMELYRSNVRVCELLSEIETLQDQMRRLKVEKTASNEQETNNRNQVAAEAKHNFDNPSKNMTVESKLAKTCSGAKIVSAPRRPPSQQKMRNKEAGRHLSCSLSKVEIKFAGCDKENVPSKQNSYSLSRRIASKRTDVSIPVKQKQSNLQDVGQPPALNNFTRKKAGDRIHRTSKVAWKDTHSSGTLEQKEEVTACVTSSSDDSFFRRVDKSKNAKAQKGSHDMKGKSGSSVSTRFNAILERLQTPDYSRSAL